MTAIVHHCVIHHLSVDNDAMQLHPRDSLIPLSSGIEQLVEQIHQVYSSKPAKGVGGFVQDVEGGEIPGFVTEFETWRREPEVFLEFSLSASRLLVKTLADFGTVESGFIVYAHYQFLATDYLLIALVNTKAHVEVSNGLDIAYSTHLDLAKMQLAARVNLTDLDINADKHRYLSFIKGRIGRKVSDFFLAFLGCQEQVDVKQQNKSLVQNLDAFLASESMDSEEKQRSLETASDYYKSKLEAGDDINVTELSGHLPSADTEHSFAAFVERTEVPLEENFQPDRTMVNKLGKFSGQGGGISLSFDRKFLGERIFYDPQSDTLTIKGLPPNLKDQLSRTKV